MVRIEGPPRPYGQRACPSVRPSVRWLSELDSRHPLDATRERLTTLYYVECGSCYQTPDTTTTHSHAHNLHLPRNPPPSPYNWRITAEDRGRVPEAPPAGPPSDVGVTLPPPVSCSRHLHEFVSRHRRDDMWSTQPSLSLKPPHTRAGGISG